MRSHPEILLTSVDSDRLARLTTGALRRPPEVEALDEVLRTARVVEPRDVPANFVTMNSQAPSAMRTLRASTTCVSSIRAMPTSQGAACRS